jgi:hypothetical protein
MEKVEILIVHFLMADIIYGEKNSYNITKRLIDDYHKNNNSLDGLESWLEIYLSTKRLIWKM